MIFNLSPRTWLLISATAFGISLGSYGSHTIMKMHYDRDIDRCAQGISRNAYHLCPSNIESVLLRHDYKRQEKVIEYRDRIVTVENKTIEIRWKERETVQADVKEIEEVKADEIIIDSDHLRAARRQLCNIAQDCSATD